MAGGESVGSPWISVAALICAAPSTRQTGPLVWLNVTNREEPRGPESANELDPFMVDQADAGLEYDFPPVAWSDIRDHIVTRLMMDPEWTVEGDESLMWWPTPLPMTIEVVGSGTFPDSPENWIRVRGETLIAEVDDSRGRDIASEYLNVFPTGVLTYRDGWLRLSTIYSFNPRNRTLLEWFHESLLIQAVTALEFAAELEESKGIQVNPASHPSSGQRDDVDELCRIYVGEELGLPVDNGVSDRYAFIRPSLRDAILQDDYQRGFSNEEVDFFNSGFGFDEIGPLDEGAFDFGIGFMPGTALDAKLGPSLRITARILPPGVTFDEEQVTYANEALCNLVDTSVFGYISGPENEPSGSCVWAVVPHLTLAGWSRLDPLSFQTSILNAVWHVTAAAQRLRRDVLGIDWQPDRAGE